jgi:hypothetical protein
VEISTIDPFSRNRNVELWYDPDAPTPIEVFPNEVVISTAAPVAPGVELWYDPDAPDLPPVNEVFIGVDPPTDPNVELWFDPDAVTP